MTMNQDSYSLVVIYGLLVIIGGVGGIGDVLLYKWAKSQNIVWLIFSYFAWLFSLTLLGFFLRLEHLTFGATIVLATAIHLVVGLVWSFCFVGNKPSRLEMAGIVLAVAAVILMEMGRAQAATSEQ